MGVKVKIPDYRIYKVEDCPPLKKIEEQLAAKGLKDPWLRNHVWKYRNEITNHSRNPWYKVLALPGTIRGLVLGLAAAGVYTVGDFMLSSRQGSQGHGHSEQVVEKEDH